MSPDPAKQCCSESSSSGKGFICNRQSPANDSSLPANKMKILFVDDEPSMIRVLKMGMRSMASQWDTYFAEGGEQGLAMIQQQSFDVVVTDMRMSGINGAQLLNHVLRLQPETIRIILSGYSDLRDVVNCVGLTHQFLTKPCSLEDLKNCLKRVTSVKQQLTNDKLRALTGSMASLPSMPEVYLEIGDILQSPLSSAHRIGEIASKDPALSAKLLQLSNSAFFGFSRKVYSVTEAVQLLGVGIIQALALAVPLFSAFDRKKCPQFSIDQVWEHSAETAAICRKISARHLSNSFHAEQAFAAGILHDIGKLILADKLPDKYGEIITRAKAANLSITEVERQQLGTSHAEVGGYLLALWGLPVPLVEAVASHHDPARCGRNEFCLAGAVHIASVLQHEAAPHADAGVVNKVDEAYLKQVGVSHEFETWRKELREIVSEAG
jgi:putative nucleotidyltransferase with HDIG domain